MAQNWGEFHFISILFLTWTWKYLRPGASSLVASHPAALASCPSADCFDFCLTWSNRGHLVYCLWPHVVVLNSHFGVPFSFTTTQSFNAIVLQRGGAIFLHQCLSVSLCFWFLCRSNRISKVELPLDWVEKFHEPLLSFKPAIHFIAPWFGLAPKPSHYFSRFGLGSEDFRCLICWIQKFQRALVGLSPTARVAVLFDGVSDVRLDFFYLACCSLESRGNTMEIALRSVPSLCRGGSSRDHRGESYSLTSTRASSRPGNNGEALQDNISLSLFLLLCFLLVFKESNLGPLSLD